MKNSQQTYIYSTSLPFLLWTCYNPDVADHESRVVDGKSHYLHVVGAHWPYYSHWECEFCVALSKLCIPALHHSTSSTNTLSELVLVATIAVVDNWEGTYLVLCKKPLGNKEMKPCCYGNSYNVLSHWLLVGSLVPCASFRGPAQLDSTF